MLAGVGWYKSYDLSHNHEYHVIQGILQFPIEFQIQHPDYRQIRDFDDFHDHF